MMTTRVSAHMSNEAASSWGVREGAAINRDIRRRSNHAFDSKLVTYRSFEPSHLPLSKHSRVSLACSSQLSPKRTELDTKPGKNSEDIVFRLLLLDNLSSLLLSSLLALLAFSLSLRHSLTLLRRRLRPFLIPIPSILLSSRSSSLLPLPRRPLLLRSTSTSSQRRRTCPKQQPSAHPSPTSKKPTANGKGSNSPPSPPADTAASFFLITPQVLLAVLGVLKPAATRSFSRSISGGDFRQDQACWRTRSSFSVKVGLVVGVVGGVLGGEDILVVVVVIVVGEEGEWVWLGWVGEEGEKDGEVKGRDHMVVGACFTSHGLGA